MRHLIVGYGYCGYYLAQLLSEQRQQVWTLSRSPVLDQALPQVTHIQADVTFDSLPAEPFDVIYYLVPPPSAGRVDTTLQIFLRSGFPAPKKAIYFGSSGIYGDQQGQPTTEKTPCHLVHDRQFRRMSAEQLWQDYAAEHGVRLAILRVAGILGPERIPLRRVLNHEPVVKVAEAPWTNSIYVQDLVEVAWRLARKLRSTQCFNVSDGLPTPMGSTHRLLAVMMGESQVYEETLEEILQKVSPMRREFILSSKKLVIDKLKAYIGDDFEFTDKVAVLKDSLEATAFAF